MARKETDSQNLALPSNRKLVLTRTFDAPRGRLFEAYTDPRLIPQWWGPARYATTVEKMDVRPGGAWRYTQRGTDGSQFAFNGVYREVVPSERLVSTFEFEPLPGHVAVDTAVFEDLGDRSRLTVTSVFQSAEDRDGMLSSGAEEGAIETWERLAKLLG